MKAHLLYRNQDFDFAAELPANRADLIQDLELTTLLEAMAAGDEFLFDVSARVMLTSLTEPGAIRYRQECWPTASRTRRSSARYTPSPSARCRTSAVSGDSSSSQ